MKIRLIAWTLTALLAASLTGCGAAPETPSQPENAPDSTAPRYSNLADDASREEVSAILSARARLLTGSNSFSLEWRITTAG